VLVGSHTSDALSGEFDLRSGAVRGRDGPGASNSTGRHGRSAYTGGRSLDDLIRPGQQRRRDRETERLGGLEVDDELELGGLLNRQIRRLGAI
jgi:hypothetical protein